MIHILCIDVEGSYPFQGSFIHCPPGQVEWLHVAALEYPFRDRAVNTAACITARVIPKRKRLDAKTFRSAKKTKPRDPQCPPGWELYMQDHHLEIVSWRDKSLVFLIACLRPAAIAPSRIIDHNLYL